MIKLQARIDSCNRRHPKQTLYNHSPMLVNNWGGVVVPWSPPDHRPGSSSFAPPKKLPSQAHLYNTIWFTGPLNVVDALTGQANQACSSQQLVACSVYDPRVPPSSSQPPGEEELHLPAASLDPAGLSPGEPDTVRPAVTHRIVDYCGGSSCPPG